MNLRSGFSTSVTINVSYARAYALVAFFTRASRAAIVLSSTKTILPMSIPNASTSQLEYSELKRDYRFPPDVGEKTRTYFNIFHDADQVTIRVQPDCSHAASHLERFGTRVLCGDQGTEDGWDIEHSIANTDLVERLSEGMQLASIHRTLKAAQRLSYTSSCSTASHSLGRSSGSSLMSMSHRNPSLFTRSMSGKVGFKMSRWTVDLAQQLPAPLLQMLNLAKRFTRSEFAFRSTHYALELGPHSFHMYQASNVPPVVALYIGGQPRWRTLAMCRALTGSKIENSGLTPIDGCFEELIEVFAENDAGSEHALLPTEDSTYGQEDSRIMSIIQEEACRIMQLRSEIHDGMSFGE